MTLTQIPACIDQHSAYLNETCPVLFLTMPHPFQSSRNRIETKVQIERRIFYFFITKSWRPPCHHDLRKLSYFILILIFSNVDSFNAL